MKIEQSIGTPGCAFSPLPNDNLIMRQKHPKPKQTKTKQTQTNKQPITNKVPDLLSTAIMLRNYFRN